MRILTFLALVLLGGLVLVGFVVAFPTSSATALLSGRMLIAGRSSCSVLDTVRAVRSNLKDDELLRAHINASRLVTRDGQGFEQWQTKQGTFWITPGSTPKNSNQAHGWFYGELVEQEMNIYGADTPRPGDIVLDCGANFGAFTHKALNRGARLVIAIDPSPDSVECLRRNFSKEIASGRVIVYPKGVWNKPDRLTLYVNTDFESANSVVFADGKKPSVTVPLTTIDLLMADLNLPRVDFIKMDIEGSEQEAIAGAAQTIKRFHPRMALCVYHKPEDAARVPQAVQAIASGYNTECPCWLWRGRISPDVMHFR